MSMKYQVLLMSMAVFRLYLEVIGFDFEKLPLSKHMAKIQGAKNMRRFHRMGLIFSMAHILFYAPGLLF